MKRATKILNKISDDLMTEIGDMANDYGIRDERTVGQQMEILALIQFNEHIEEAIRDLDKYMKKPTTP